VIDSRGEYDPVCEIEGLIRSASNYVRVSRDLRPRVVDAARLNIRERRVRRVIRQIVVAAAIATWIVISTIGRMKTPYANHGLPITAAGAFPIPARVAGGGEDWTLVDIFTELRDKQADVLRF
jgi:hypothetical protein